MSSDAGIRVGRMSVVTLGFRKLQRSFFILIKIKIMNTQTYSAVWHSELWKTESAYATSSRRPSPSTLTCGDERLLEWTWCRTHYDIQIQRGQKVLECVFTRYCSASDAFQPVFSGRREHGNPGVILQHFLLSWSAAITNQEGINESALM